MESTQLGISSGQHLSRTLYVGHSRSSAGQRAGFIALLAAFIVACSGPATTPRASSMPAVSQSPQAGVKTETPTPPHTALPTPTQALSTQAKLCNGHGSTAVVGLHSGLATGYERCGDDTIHKVGPAQCDNTTPLPSCDGSDGSPDCSTDADCTEFPNGQCARGQENVLGQWVPACACAYPCTTDDDCGPAQVCACDGLVDSPLNHATCVPAPCKQDDECESGECGLSFYDDGCGYLITTACRTEDDTCRNEYDCSGSDCSVAPAPPSGWSCNGPTCISKGM